MSVADIPDDPQAQLIDARYDLPLSVYWEIDDLPISPEAMRVYVHLIRRSAKEGKAWPSYQSIGDHCFKTGDFTEGTRRVYAIRAVKELLELGLIVKRLRPKGNGQKNDTNLYQITPRELWKSFRGNPQLPSNGNPQLPKDNQPQDNQKPSREKKNKPVQHSSESPAFPSQEPLLTAPTTPLPPAVKSLTGGVGPRAALPVADIERCIKAWNDNRGSLPEVSSNRNVEKKLIEELKRKPADELALLITQGAKEVSADEYWKEKRFGLLNLLRHLDTKAEAYRSRQPIQRTLDPIWNPASFKPGMRVWYCSDIFAGKWDWATVVAANVGPEWEPMVNAGFTVDLRLRNGNLHPEWNHNLAFKNPEET